jgi:TRAP-type C4-dicarboxylate transport system substrate-binding protein
MDGKLGAFVRTQIASAGLIAFETIYDNGFREITTSNRPIKSPDDLKALRIRVPPAALWTSMFKDFGAAPTTISFNEVYTSLQTKIVDAQENPLALINAAKLYEVQKYCSLTNHMWDGFWMLANPAAFERLPAASQAIVRRELNAAALRERQDIAGLSATLQTSLAQKGLAFNKTNPTEFRQALKTAGFYDYWQGQFGPQAWSLLESYTGPLG